MNADTATPTGPTKTRKLILQLVSGALTGGLVTFGVLSLLGEGGFDIDDPARAIALVAGLIFAITGGMIAVGLAAPRIGSQLLNVEDAEELREQGKPLRQGATVFLLGGLGLIALAVTAVGGAPGVLSVEAGLVIAGLCFAAAAIVSYRNRNVGDELMRQLSREASALAMSIVTLIALIWGSLAYLSLAPWISPLGLLAGLFVIQLASVFWVIGKRGMLAPR